MLLRGLKKKNRSDDRPLVTLLEPKSPSAEAFRTLRTNIQFANVEKPVKSILVASAGPAEGKSTVVANLGVTLAVTGLKVLIMDCDLRKPAQHQVFKLSNRTGLTSLLLEQASAEEAVQASAVENLSVLTSGPLPPNPSEMLGSRRFQAVLADFIASYDYVLLDSAPAGVVTDSIVLSTLVDGVILVLYTERVKLAQVKYVQEQLAKADAYLLGVVLNHVPRNGRSYQYYQYYYSE